MSTEQRWSAAGWGGAVAGWYSDPDDPSMLRYWDGGAWSDHVAPGVRTSASTASDMPSGRGQSARPPVDGFAITSLITGLIGGVLISVGFGIAALVRIRQGTRSGTGVAVAGLSLSAVWVVVLIATIAFGAGRAPDRATDGTVTRAGQVPVSNLRTGDCVHVPRVLTGDMVNADLTPCSQLHNGQVFTVLRASVQVYPGDTQLRTRALDDCQGALQSFLGRSATRLHIVAIFPNLRAWNLGDRYETCLLVDRQQDITGDIRADA